MTTFDGKTIGSRVASYRRLNGWTMGELSERSGNEVGRAVIANIETGRKHDLTVSQLAALSSALGVPMVALMTDLTEMRDQAPAVGVVSQVTGVTQPDPSVPASPLVWDVLANYRAFVETERELKGVLLALAGHNARMADSKPDPDRMNDHDLHAILVDRMDRAMGRRADALAAMEAASERLATSMGIARNDQGGENGEAENPAE